MCTGKNHHWIILDLLIVVAFADLLYCGSREWWNQVLRTGRDAGLRKPESQSPQSRQD